MTSYTLDTHAAVRDLEEAGVERAQAEAIVNTLARADSDLVTKADLRAEIAALERRILIAGVAIASPLFAALRFTG